MQRLGAALRELAPRAVITCARGSSDHAATYARYLLETRAGLLTSSASPSVSSVYATPPQWQGTAFIAISQSGASPDLLATVEAAKTAGACVIACVNAEGSPLARAAHHVVPLCAGVEASVAATKSHLASLSALADLIANWLGDAALLAELQRLPQLMRQAWELDWSEGASRLASVEHLYVIGRGVGFGAAQEMALKFKETCGLHAEPFSAAEVRHGPMALVGPAFPVMLLSQRDGTHEGIEQLATDLIEGGVPVIAAGVRHADALELPTLAADSAVEPLLMLQSFYRMVNSLALARGRDPDRPPRLRKVTETV
jgi:glucosamine--fructose-6-phosphate aminotransferase (isomerizing)